MVAAGQPGLRPGTRGDQLHDPSRPARRGCALPNDPEMNKLYEHLSNDICIASE